jgi:glutathione S-transferase
MSENFVQYGTSVLLIGSKNYSSWSLRPWLFLRKAGFKFREQLVYFDAGDYQAQIAALSPSRRVPLLIDGGLKIWDSLAICEYVAELTGSGAAQERCRSRAGAFGRRRNALGLSIAAQRVPDECACQKSPRATDAAARSRHRARQ